MSISGVSGISSSQSSLWNTIIERLINKQANQDSQVGSLSNTEIGNSLSRLSDIVSGEKSVSLTSFLADLSILNENDELEKDALLDMIRALLSKLASGNASPTLLKALGALIGELGDIAPELLDDLMPDIKQTLTTVVRAALNNPNSKLAIGILKQVAKVLRQIGIQPKNFIQSIGSKMGINAEAIDDILTAVLDGSDQTNPKLPLTIDSTGLKLDHDTVVAIDLPALNAINQASLPKLEKQLGDLLDNITLTPPIKAN